MRWCLKPSLALFLLCLPVFSAEDTANIDATIRQQDAVFWDAYNRCDVEKMSEFFWPDFEFYHDKGGLTVGHDAFVAALKTGLCGKPNYLLRREAIADTVKVYPLRKEGVTYGAVISGDHYFYINDNGKPEYRDSAAKFFHVWLRKDGTWKMARAISYDHRDAPEENERKEVMLPAAVLDQYVGKYQAPKTGALTVSCADHLLTLEIGEKAMLLHPASGNLFFVTERDLTFEFVTAGGKVSKIVVREHGVVMEEAERE